MDYPRAPPPFPAGWYCIGISRALAAGQIIERRFMGRDIVVFRTAGGQACAMDAYCPHLGAHLGRGGRIVEESIRCPFHHFRFDTGGRCIATGYGTRPPKSGGARTWPVEERNGIILAYHAPDRSAPTWSVPEIDWRGWSPLLLRSWRIRGHPQETTENSVDLGHFAAVHAYEDVREVRRAAVDGPHLHAAYRMRRKVRFAGLPIVSLISEFEVHAFGLGYSYVETRMSDLGISIRQLILACPTDEEEIDLTVALSVQRVGMFGPILNRVLPHLAFREFCQDVQQDFAMWAHKRYVPRPLLAEGDGPIGTYRRWTPQFYLQDR